MTITLPGLSGAVLVYLAGFRAYRRDGDAAAGDRRSHRACPMSA